MKWYADCIVNHRGKVALLTSLITLGGVVAGFRVGFDERPRSTFSRSDENYRMLEQLWEDFGSDDKDLLIVLSGQDLFTPEAIGLLWKIVKETAEVDGIDTVMSLARIRRQGSFIFRLLPFSDTSDDRLARARNEAMKHPLVAGQLLSSDGRTMLVVLRLTDDTTMTSQFERIVADVRGVTQAAARGSAISVRVTGLPAIYADTLVSARRETLSFTCLAAVVSTLIAVLLFRRPSAVLISAAGPIVGVTWTIGAMGLMGEKLNGINAVVPALLLVVGFTDAVHLLVDIRCSLASGHTRTKAAWRAVRHLGPACALASLTTAIAFASLALADTEVVRRFGTVCCCGAVLTFIAVITMVPLLTTTRLGDGVLQTSIKDSATLDSPRLARLAVVLLTHFRWISMAAIVVTMVLLRSALQLRPEFLLTEGIPDGCETNIAMAQCDEAFGGAHLAYVVVQWPQTLSLRSPRVMEVTSAVHEVLDDEPLATGSFSLLNVLQSLPGSGPALQRRVGALRRAPPEWRRRLVRPDRQRLVVGTHVPNVGSTEIQLALSRVTRDLAELHAKHPDFKFWLTGTSVVASSNVHGLVGDLARSLGLAAALVFAVVALAFRSLRLGLVSVIPNAFPLLLTASLLVWTGNALRVASVVSFSLCLGLAVDDTIHLLVRFNRERRHGSDMRLAIVRSVSSVGIAVVTTTMILGAGFAAMMLSYMPVVREFAWFSLLAILSALIGDLLLLPPLLYWCAPAAERSSDSGESRFP
jgi:hypothetical protein